MTVLASNCLTLADHASRIDKDGKIAKITEMLAQTNEILLDMKTMPCNDGTSHTSTQRTGIPTATWRMINKGVPKGKSTTAQVKDATGMLEIYAEIDKKLVDLAEDKMAFRLSEAKPFAEGMNQTMATTIFYGNTQVTPERFVGLSPRYNTLDPAKAASAKNVIDGGGVGSTNTSAWLVTWSEETTHGIFPKGTQAGILHEDKGQQTLLDADGNQYEGYRDHWQWDLGLAVRDWRYNARVANIDVADMMSDDTALKSLIRKMILASEKLFSTGMGTGVWYVNRDVKSALRIAILEKISNNLSWENVAGKRVMVFDDYPVRLCDALVNTEARVTI